MTVGTMEEAPGLDLPANARTLRIAVVNWGRRGLGGVESYIAGILPHLHALGHTLALWTEYDQPLDREPIPLPPGTPEWCAEELTLDGALAELRAWSPDLLFVQSVTRPDVEAALLEVAPAVLFAHGYAGACISGERLHKSTGPTVCSRDLGPGCLLHYYPHRCGGLSPVTMIRDYRRNMHRRDLLGAYRGIVANSTHVRDVYARVAGTRTPVHALPLPVAERGPRPAPLHAPAVGEPWRLLYTGRMSMLKGGRVLLDALPEVVARLGQPVHLALAGDGPDRGEWERLAADASARADDRLTTEFVGWKDDADLDRLRDSSHLLVVPSVWPEPFGLVGPEAGLRGVPAVAFASGGITDWLIDGVNGYLAPADPPTGAGLAAAIVRSLQDPRHYAALCEGAVREARRFSPAAHVSALLRAFAEAVGATSSAR